MCLVVQTSQPARLLGPSHFKDSPSVGVSARFLLALACYDSLPDISLVIVNPPVGGAEASSGLRVSGCSRTFESNVQWRLLDRTGAVPASGHTSGGGIDRPALLKVHRRVRIHRAADRAPRGFRGRRLRRPGLPTAPRRRPAGDLRQRVNTGAAGTSHAANVERSRAQRGDTDWSHRGSHAQALSPVGLSAETCPHSVNKICSTPSTRHTYQSRSTSRGSRPAGGGAR